MSEDKGKRGFHHLSKAWYGPACLKDMQEDDSISIGIYHEDGGTSGEFSVSWHHLGGEVVPRLDVWDDGWAAMNLFKDLTEAMGTHNNENMAPDKFASMLKKCGVEDMTKTMGP